MNNANHIIHIINNYINEDQESKLTSASVSNIKSAINELSKVTSKDTIIEYRRVRLVLSSYLREIDDDARKKYLSNAVKRIKVKPSKDEEDLYIIIDDCFNIIEKKFGPSINEAIVLVKNKDDFVIISNPSISKSIAYSVFRKALEQSGVEITVIKAINTSLDNLLSIINKA
jgi:hypothetical protein